MNDACTNTTISRVFWNPCLAFSLLSGLFPDVIKFTPEKMNSSPYNNESM